MKRNFHTFLPNLFLLMGILMSVSSFGQQAGTLSYAPAEQGAVLQYDSSQGKEKQQIVKAVTLGTTGSLESYYNFMGGIKPGAAFAALLDANMNLNLEKLIGLKKGTFYVDFEYHGGDNPTSKLTGDLQVFDKNNADPFFEVLEIWYQQILFHDKLRIKLGKVDANTEFSVIDNGLGFINSPTQVTPAFPVFPTFPAPMPGITMFFNLNHLFFADFALYDANQSDHFLNFYGDPSAAQLSKHGQLFIAETGLNWDNFPVLGHNGNFKVGLWKHNGHFTGFYGNQIHGLAGVYVIYDQTLWKSVSEKHSKQSIRMFLEYGFTDSRISPIFRHYGGGVVWDSPIKSRPGDELGFSVQDADISSGLQVSKKHELNLEAYYQLTLSNEINLKPDFQYIVNPGGIYHNALIGTFMLNFTFPN